MVDWHCYWLLETPAGPADIPRIRDINDRLAAHFSGDNVSDASRILRLPGTVNFKYNPPRPARLLYADPGILYQLSDFDFLSPVPPKTTPAAVTEQQSWLTPVTMGKRHTRATQITGHYLGKNLPVDDVREILRVWNNGNKPPLEETELFRVVGDLHTKHIAKQGPDTTYQEDDLIGDQHLCGDRKRRYRYF